MSVLKVFVNSDPFVWWSLNEDKLMKMNSDYQLKCYIFIDQSIDIFTLIFNLIVKRLKQRFQTLKFQTLLWITNDDLLIQTLTNKTNLNSINIGQFISIAAPPSPPPPPAIFSTQFYKMFWLNFTIICYIRSILLDRQIDKSKPLFKHFQKIIYKVTFTWNSWNMHLSMAYLL